MHYTHMHASKSTFHACAYAGRATQNQFLLEQAQRRTQEVPHEQAHILIKEVFISPCLTVTVCAVCMHKDSSSCSHISTSFSAKKKGLQKSKSKFKLIRTHIRTVLWMFANCKWTERNYSTIETKTWTKGRKRNQSTKKLLRFKNFIT